MIKFELYIFESKIFISCEYLISYLETDNEILDNISLDENIFL